MKTLGLAALCTAAILCSCEERIFTAEELGMIIDWGYCGWSEVLNDTDGTVTLTTSYSYADIEDIISVIKPGDYVELKIGAFAPGVSIQECRVAKVRLLDGTEIVCTRWKEDAWSKRFFEQFEEREEFEVVEMGDGKKVRHDLVVCTYHIDDTLIDLWREGHNKNY